MKLGIFGIISAAGAICCAGARAEGDVDLTALSLKRIMDLDVTSVSKRTQKMRDVATSIYVINEDDIRRSGATRLQDLLKLAPGAWFSDASYTMPIQGVREGANFFSTTQAWLLDGVPITNPIIGGIFFNAFDIPLEDIERIEVIKGPGGTIYGANSASGIVSIFTKRGEAAEGMKVSLAGGTQNYLAPYVRYGVEARDDLFLTLWGRFKTHDGYDRNPLFSGDSLDAPINGGGELRVANHFRGRDDYQEGISGGLKWEYQPYDDWKWSGQILQSNVADGQYSVQLFLWPDAEPASPQAQQKRPDSVYTNREEMDQTIVQARLDVTQSRDDAWFVNAYHLRNRYDVALASGIQMGYDISELEAQKNIAISRNHLSAGANARRVQFEFADMRDDGSAFVSNPHNLAYLLGGFLQDEIEIGKRWNLTLGAKAETWTLISMVPEISPSVRFAYKPSEEMTWWAAASRSITTPAYAQWDIEVREAEIPPEWYLRKNVPGYAGNAPGAGHFVALVPGDDVKPVTFYSLEAGHRGSYAQKLQWDVSTFYSWVRGQLGATPLDSTFQTLVASKAHPPDSIVPVYETNLADYESFGGEALARYLPTEFLRLELSYCLFYIHNFQGEAIPGDSRGRTFEMPEDYLRRTPNHVGRAKVYCDLPFGFGLSVSGLVSSSYSRGEAFNYFEQLPVSQTLVHNQSIIVDPPSMEYQLDFSLQKHLMNDRLAVTVWGRNVLADPFVENYNQYGWTTFPHQVHRTFGTGLVYQF
ncbi:MAG: TonB-dependent receptor, plug [Fibrobacteres bacterium]|nr:TonB-dependent receptor, plug [Fibrobacterota bacterium]